MWEVMSFGERPYWDMSNQDVSTGGHPRSSGRCVCGAHPQKKALPECLLLPGASAVLGFGDETGW